MHTHAGLRVACGGDVLQVDAGPTEELGLRLVKFCSVRLLEGGDGQLRGLSGSPTKAAEQACGAHQHAAAESPPTCATLCPWLDFPTDLLSFAASMSPPAISAGTGFLRVKDIAVLCCVSCSCC